VLHPRLSVLLPVWNGERFLDEAIESIVRQDFRDLELIVIDDGSTDATPHLLARWRARDDRIVLLHHETNLGTSAALNDGLAVARGAYVAQQDADDVSEAGRLSAQVALLDANPSVVLISMNYHVIDEAGTILQTTQLDHPPEVIEHLLHFSNALGGHTQVMYRRDAVRALGGYDATKRASLDYDLWSRLAGCGRFVVLPQAGMRHRVHDSRITVRDNARQVQESWNTTRRMLTRYLAREIADDELRAIATTWRRHVPSPRPDLAHRVLEEAYRVFARMHSDPDLQRRVRIVTAQRLAETAATLLRHGHLRDAIRHLGFALRWEPAGVLRVMRNALQKMRRPEA
jgi:glycosyltransferase involved in cell wall biosynthesis